MVKHNTILVMWGSGLISEPFFSNKGMIFVYVHSKRNIPSFSDILKTCATCKLICFTLFSSSFGGIPSITSIYFIMSPSATVGTKQPPRAASQSCWNGNSCEDKLHGAY